MWKHSAHKKQKQSKRIVPLFSILLLLGLSFQKKKGLRKHKLHLKVSILRFCITKEQEIYLIEKWTWTYLSVQSAKRSFETRFDSLQNKNNKDKNSSSMKIYLRIDLKNRGNYWKEKIFWVETTNTWLILWWDFGWHGF